LLGVMRLQLRSGPRKLKLTLNLRRHSLDKRHTYPLFPLCCLARVRHPRQMHLKEASVLCCNFKFSSGLSERSHCWGGTYALGCMQTSLDEHFGLLDVLLPPFSDEFGSVAFPRVKSPRFHCSLKSSPQKMVVPQ
jgi:hypothetical protein